VFYFFIQPPEQHKKYLCFYYNNHRNPRLLLQPAKIEIANLKPRVWMLRNVLSESEMNRLKELASPKVCMCWFYKLICCFDCCSVLRAYMVVCSVEISIWYVKYY